MVGRWRCGVDAILQCDASTFNNFIKLKSAASKHYFNSLKSHTKEKADSFTASFLEHSKCLPKCILLKCHNGTWNLSTDTANIMQTCMKTVLFDVLCAPLASQPDRCAIALSLPFVCILLSFFYLSLPYLLASGHCDRLKMQKQ